MSELQGYGVQDKICCDRRALTLVEVECCIGHENWRNPREERGLNAGVQE